ncbi:hypothetical protein VTJ83DRAFT_4462 [Remersonia thermophila]|uniref:Uncharacterized protein n=1 Tax=Remersonia thermophila TaxID=72144 RepID=A0ABR4DA29_9PEZI
MAGDSTRTAESRGESSRAQETPQSQNESTREPSEDRRQQQGSNATPPPIPLQPLPPPHHEKARGQRPHVPPASYGVQYTPYQPQPPLPLSPRQPRPYHPKWHLTKLALVSFSLVVSAVIFGICIGLGFLNAPYRDTQYWWSTYPIDSEFGISGATAGLAVIVGTLELLVTMRSSRRVGMHPGLLVALHLFIWILAVFAVMVVSFYATDTYEDYYYAEYEYPEERYIELLRKSRSYEKALLAFNCILLTIHFVLFIGACVDTHEINTQKKKVVLIPVPVSEAAYRASLPPGARAAGYPGAAPYPIYPPPVAYAVPAAGSRASVPPPPPVLYGGYYAPAPQGAELQAPQLVNPGFQGYYAPVVVADTSAGHRRRSSQPRGSKRHSRGAPPSQPTEQPAEQPAAQNDQARGESSTTEKTS